MNYDIHIENLGAIKESDITITPLTILAGENGTGKSFVTKFFYSVLNVTILDIFSNELNFLLTDIDKSIARIIRSIGSRGFNLHKLGIMSILKTSIDETAKVLRDNIEYPIVVVDPTILEDIKKSIESYNTAFSNIFDSKEEEQSKLENSKSQDIVEPL